MSKYLVDSILTHCINQMHDGIERAKDAELLNCKSGAEYLLSKLRMAAQSAKTTQDLWKKQTHADDCNKIHSLILIQSILSHSSSFNSSIPE